MIDIGCTPGEIMACILHEIGHNFQCTPMHNIFCVTDYLWIPVYFRNAIKRYAEFAKLSVSQLPKDQLKALWKLYAAYEWLNRTGTAIVSRLWSEFASENAKEAFAEFDAWVTKNKNRLKEELAEQVKELKKRREETKKDKDVFATGMVFNIFTTLATQVALGIISPTTFANQMYEAQSGYTGEVFADSFATAYGYGSETVSLQQRLEKMNTNNKYFKKDNKYNVYNQYLLCMMEVMFTFLDPHPMTQTRIKNQINKLRKELNSEEVPPQLKVLIEKDLQKAEKLYEEYLKMSPAEKHLSVIINFRNINETYFGGKLELRDLINRMLNFGKAEA